MSLFLQNKWLTFAVVLILIYTYIDVYKERREASPSTTQKTEITKVIPAENLAVRGADGEDTLLSQSFKKALDLAGGTKNGQQWLQSAFGTALKEKLNGQTLLEYRAVQTGEAQTLDILKGKGDIAFCSTEVTIHYDAFLTGGAKIDSTRISNRPLTFVIGEGRSNRELEYGIVGMQQGGLRKIAVPGTTIEEGKPAVIEGPIVVAGNSMTYEVQLLSMKHAAPGYKNLPILQKSTRGTGHHLGCGEKATLRYKAYTSSNKPLTGEAPWLETTVIPGAGNIPWGLEQSILGLRPGGSKTIVLTTDLLPSRTGTNILAPLGEVTPGQMVTFEVSLPAEEPTKTP